jgi:inorganic phosphate transporter, PiT family
MATAATSVLDSKLQKSPGKLGTAIFGGALLIGISYAAVNLVSDLSGFHATSIMPYLLLTLALMVAWALSS